MVVLLFFAVVVDFTIVAAVAGAAADAVVGFAFVAAVAGAAAVAVFAGPAIVARNLCMCSSSFAPAVRLS